MTVECSRWSSDLISKASVEVARWIGGDVLLEHTLHLFVDASERAFGCCIYLLNEKSQQLIYAKSRVAPLKLQTLARMELQAAYLDSKYPTFVKSFT